MSHGLKPGDIVLRTVTYNRHPRKPPFKSGNARVSRVTKSGYVYLEGHPFEKFHGDDFPLQEWRPRGYSPQYIVQLHALTSAIGEG